MIRSVLQMTKDLISLLTVFYLLLVSTGCENGASSPPPKVVPAVRDHAPYPAFIETPSGDMQTLSFNLETEVFDTLGPEAGGLRPDYLPYPLNAGFLPAHQDAGVQKLPVWVLGKRLSPGDTLSVQILGLIEYVENGTMHEDFVAVPSETGMQTIKVQRFRDFMIDYDAVRFMFETWLKNRNGIGAVSRISWMDEDKAQDKLSSIFNHPNE